MSAFGGKADIKLTAAAGGSEGARRSTARSRQRGPQVHSEGRFFLNFGIAAKASKRDGGHGGSIPVLAW
jgi:hypothetical protein